MRLTVAPLSRLFGQPWAIAIAAETAHRRISSCCPAQLSVGVPVFVVRQELRYDRSLVGSESSLGGAHTHCTECSDLARRHGSHGNLSDLLDVRMWWVNASIWFVNKDFRI